MSFFSRHFLTLADELGDVAVALSAAEGDEALYGENDNGEEEGLEVGTITPPLKMVPTMSDGVCVNFAEPHGCGSRCGILELEVRGMAEEEEEKTHGHDKASEDNETCALDAADFGFGCSSLGSRLNSRSGICSFHNLNTKKFKLLMMISSSNTFLFTLLSTESWY